MESNPFAPSPETDYVSHHADGDAAPSYYVVSPFKFLTLFFATFSGYFLYWSYKQWTLYSDRTKLNCWPIARAVFAIFYTHSLFSVMRTELDDKNANYEWNNTLGATVIVLVLLFNLIDQFGVFNYSSIDMQLMLLLLVTILGLISYFLLQAQKVANFLCSDPNGRSNSKFTLANFFWIILGSILWFFTILGCLFLGLF